MGLFVKNIFETVLSAATDDHVTLFGKVINVERRHHQLGQVLGRARVIRPCQPGDTLVLDTAID